MNSSRYYPETANNNKNVSRLIKAFEGMQTGLEPYFSSPKGMFGRVAIIQSNGVTFNSAELDIEYDVPFDDDIEANEAEIIIYNLSDTTIQALKYNNVITITAGYNTDTGVIFEGVISKVTSKWEGLDRKTVIRALDDKNLQEKELEEITFGKNTRASTILKYLISRVPLPLAVFNIRRDHLYKDEVKISGGLMENIKKYSEVCGISVYINKRKIYARHITEGDNLNFVACAETGLIDSPEEFEEEVTAEDYKDVIKGYKFSMILQHRLTTAAIITLESKNVSGRYRVRSGRHLFNGSETITEVEVI